MATCKGCGQRIEWRKHTGTKRPAPIDPEPAEGGNILAVGDSWYRVAMTTQDWAGPLRMNHFLTCKKPEAFQRRDPVGRQHQGANT